MNFWQTSKIRLRGVEPSDTEHFVRWNLDSEMAAHLDFVWPPIAEALVAQDTRDLAFKKLDGGAFTWIIEAADGQVVGMIDTHTCNERNGTFSYGIAVEAPYQRQGYAREAILLVVRYYFHYLRYEKVNVRIHADNPPSVALHESIGFVHEGTLRQMLYIAGKRIDIFCYGMLKEEWAARYEQVA